MNIKTGSSKHKFAFQIIVLICSFFLSAGIVLLYFSYVIDFHRGQNPILIIAMGFMCMVFGDTVMTLLIVYGCCLS